MNLYKECFVSAFILPEKKICSSALVLWFNWKYCILFEYASGWSRLTPKILSILNMFHAPCTTNQIHYSKLSGLHFCSDSLLAISSTFSCKAEGHPCLSGVCSESKWFFLKAVLLCKCDNLEKKVCAIQPFSLTEHCVIRKALVRKLHQFLHTSFCFRISAV